MNQPRLLIRADASPSMGIGHIMRCLALAQAWQDNGGTACFLSSNLPAALTARIQAEGFDSIQTGVIAGGAQDVSATIAAATRWEPAYVVVDGYSLGRLASPLHTNGFKVLAIDDSRRAEFLDADLWLDQNLEADPHLYPPGRALLDVRYALLRREFRAIGPRADPPEMIRKVMITMGGGNGTAGIRDCIHGLESVIQELDGTLVLGPAQGKDKRIDTCLLESRHRWTTVISPPSLADLMMEADLAISAAGSTCWELCRTGLPSLLLPVAENQRPLARAMDRQGLAVNLENLSESALTQAFDGLITNKEQRRDMSRAGQALVDGRGAPRVVNEMMGNYMEVRLATPNDSLWYWELANESAVRSSAIHSAPISLEDHQKWFNTRLSDLETILLVGFDAEGERIGQIRFQYRESSWEIDYSLVPRLRGMGLGTALLNRGMQYCSRVRPGSPFSALVRPENTPSIKAFLRAAFLESGRVEVEGIPLISFHREVGK